MDKKTEMKLIAQFMKDCSFENPNAPEFFFKKEGGKADVSLSIDIQIKKTENNLYMVDLITKTTNQLQEDKKTIFLIELVYSGLVSIKGTEDEKEIKRKLLVDVPNLLFPNVRALILRLTGESGYPPLILTPVDFEELYQRKQEQSKEPTPAN